MDKLMNFISASENRGMFIVVPISIISIWYIVEYLKEKGNSISKNQIYLLKGAVVFGIIMILAMTTMFIDVRYYKTNRDEIKKFEAKQNGWVSMERDNRTYWSFKEQGQYKKGWHIDEKTGDRYFFEEIKFDFPIKADVLATKMYDPKYEKENLLKIDSKVYEFEIGGKLIENVGWKEKNGKYLYFQEQDFGAVTNQKLEIDGKEYLFDEQGYLVK